MAIRRVGTKHVPYGPFRLGRWGLSINIVSICYTFILLIFMVLPPYQPVTSENMNYAGVVFGIVLLAGCATWLIYGRRLYQGPVREVIEELHLQ